MERQWQSAHVCTCLCACVWRVRGLRDKSRLWSRICDHAPTPVEPHIASRYQPVVKDATMDANRRGRQAQRSQCSDRRKAPPPMRGPSRRAVSRKSRWGSGGVGPLHTLGSPC
jgi:hypothetical protein